MLRRKLIIRFVRMSIEDERERIARVCDILKRHFTNNGKGQNIPEEQNLREGEENVEEKK